jgi:chromosome segregation ATPase
MENLMSRIGNLKDERDKLREDIKAASQAAKSLEMRLSREEGRVRQLETRLTRELAAAPTRTMQSNGASRKSTACATR